MESITARNRRSRASLLAASVAVAAALALAGFVWGPELMRGEPAGAADTDATAKADASVFPSGADFCFAQMMMPHHEQAVEMSEILLAKPDVSERSAKLAEFIATDQRAEVAATVAWAESWRTEYRERPPLEEVGAPPVSSHHQAAPAPVASAAPANSDLDIDALVDCGDPAVPDRFATMPGMLAPDQLDQLRAAPPHEAEILYLQLMIPHHEGAIAMSRTHLIEGANAYTVQMAKHILNEQDREVQAMTTMIAEIA